MGVRSRILPRLLPGPDPNEIARFFWEIYVLLYNEWHWFLNFIPTKNIQPWIEVLQFWWQSCLLPSQFIKYLMHDQLNNHSLPPVVIQMKVCFFFRIMTFTLKKCRKRMAEGRKLFSRMIVEQCSHSFLHSYALFHYPHIFHVSCMWVL